MNILTQNPQRNYILSKLTTKSGKILKDSVTDLTPEGYLLYFTGLFVTSSGEVWNRAYSTPKTTEKVGKILFIFNICSLDILFCGTVN